MKLRTELDALSRQTLRGVLHCGDDITKLPNLTESQLGKVDYHVLKQSKNTKG